MAVMQRTAVIWVVLDPADHVVLMCSGEDAPTVVEDWKDRGYHAVALDASEVYAA